MLGGLLGGGSDKAIKKAQAEARRLAEQSRQVANQYGERAEGLYDPYMQMGMDAWGNVQNQANNLLNSQVPEAYQFNTGGMQDLYNQYMNQAYVPEQVQANLPTTPDYEGAANSSLYKQLMQNSQDAINTNAAANGLSARGSGAALDIARAANKNTYDVANQLYQDEVNQYNLAQQNNQYRNQMLNNNYQQGIGLQQLLNQAGQQGYGNQVQSYGLENQNLLNYLNQMNQIGGMGFNATNNLNNAYANVANSQIGTNSGQAQNAINSAAAQAQNDSSMLGSLMGMAGSALSGGGLGAGLTALGFLKDPNDKGGSSSSSGGGWLNTALGLLN